MNLDVHRFTFLLILLMCMGCRHSTPRLEFITGVYHGILPCADCPGIQYQLNLKKDRTYHESSFYLDRDMTAIVDSGNYHITTDSVLILDNKSPGFNQFKILPDSDLLLLDIGGGNIESGFSDQYILSNNFETVRSAIYQNTSDVRFKFKAMGNEPFWTLDIDSHAGMHFKSLTSQQIELNTPVPDPINPQDIPGIAYRADTEEGMLHVLIVRDSCQDSMSGEVLPYRVHISTKMRTMNEPVDFVGCGGYLGDYRLNDIWMLETIDGEKVMNGQGSEHPLIALHLKDNKIIGTGGCNRFTGAITFHKDEITIGLLAATRMACPEMSLEYAFLAALSDNTFRYNFGNNKLTLSNTSHQLIFRKTD
jgi:heat shock protein HslJ/uncharacterized membrane protein